MKIIRKNTYLNSSQEYRDRIKKSLITRENLFLFSTCKFISFENCSCPKIKMVLIPEKSFYFDWSKKRWKIILCCVEMDNSLRTFLGRSVRAPHTTIFNLKTSWWTTYERRDTLERMGNSNRSLATLLLLAKSSILNTTLKEELKEKTTPRKNRLKGPKKNSTKFAECYSTHTRLPNAWILWFWRDKKFERKTSTLVRCNI